MGMKGLVFLLLLWPLHAAAQAPDAEAFGSDAWVSLPVAFAQAHADDRPVLVFVEAPWCGPCLRMKQDVFPAVQPLLERFARASLRFDDHDTRLTLGGRTQSPAAWARHFGIEATPGFVLLGPEGEVITRVTHAVDAEAFATVLAYVVTGAYRYASFEHYAAQLHHPRR